MPVHTVPPRVTATVTSFKDKREVRAGESSAHAQTRGLPQTTVTVRTEDKTALHSARPQGGTAQPDPKWEMCRFHAFSDHLPIMQEKLKFFQILNHIIFSTGKMGEK